MIFAIVSIILSTSVYAANIFTDVQFNKNVSASVVDFSYAQTNYDYFFTGKGIGNYLIRILDKNNNVLYESNFDVNFIEEAFTQNGTIQIQKDSVIKSFRLLLPDNSYFINFYNNGNLILSMSLPDYICNINSICEQNKGESSYLCPQDCSASTTTTAPSTTTTTIPSKPSTSIYIYIFIFAIIIAVILFFFYRIRLVE